MRRAVTIVAKRSLYAYAEKQFVWKVLAEFTFPDELKDAVYVKGHFLALSTDKLDALTR
jgi:hypothetical protein